LAITVSTISIAFYSSQQELSCIISEALADFEQSGMAIADIPLRFPNGDIRVCRSIAVPFCQAPFFPFPPEQARCLRQPPLAQHRRASAHRLRQIPGAIKAAPCNG
jgi:hypothetical protein